MEPADLRPCGKCGAEPRLAGQRWCRGCLTAYAVARKARLRALEPPRWEPVGPVTPAPVLVERPLHLCALCGAHRWFEHQPGVWRCEVCARTP